MKQAINEIYDMFIGSETYAKSDQPVYDKAREKMEKEIKKLLPQGVNEINLDMIIEKGMADAQRNGFILGFEYASRLWAEFGNK